MIKLRVDQGPDGYNNCMCTVLESDSTHALLRGSIKVDFAICNPEVIIKAGDIVVIESAIVYTAIANKIVNIEHNEV